MIAIAVRKGRDLLKSSFTRSVGGMMILTATGQSIYLLSGPAIGRIFSPAEFGLYGLFYTFVVTVIGLVFLNFDIAIPAATNDKDARCLTAGALVLALILAPLSGIVLASLIFWNVWGFGSLPVTAVILLVLVVLAQAIVQLLQNWYVRRQQAILIGKSSITLNVVRGLSQILFGLAVPSWWSLALGEFLGRVANVMQLNRWRRRSQPDALKIPARRDVLAALRSYRRFPLVLLPAQFIDSIVPLLQSAALAYIYGPSGLGIFFLMRRTLDIPVAFAFRSLSDTFYARLANDARVAPERVRPFFIRSALGIGGAGMLLAVPFLFAAPALFALIFGPEWQEAGVLAAIMAPASVMNLAIAPVTSIFALTNRPHLRFCFSIINLLGAIITLFVVMRFSLDLRTATICIAATTFIAYVSYFISGYIASSSLRRDMD